ncbi:MAG: pitrilysin family protein [Caldibacillus sp.]
MEKIHFPQLKENLYYERLENGLDVYILPKAGFHKTYVTFTTKYGSIDNEFIPLGKNDFIRVPDGIAHFLEHKLFEKEDGDVFQRFSQQGASANAFTSFTRTAYLFSATRNVEENLKTLIEMVQTPYFTEQTVEKEKGIIGQEIQMYNDNPDWRLYFGTIQSMYHNHPVRIDIAGTVESIHEITKDMLYECYHTFYHPSNMLLFICGPVDPKNYMNWIRMNQAEKDYTNQPEIKRQSIDEPEEVREKRRVLKMNVLTPKCMVGIKSNKTGLQGEELLKTELSLQLLFDMLFSQSSDHYQNLYDEGLIDQTFSYDFTQEETFGFALFGGDTRKPDELAEAIIEILLQAKNGETLLPEHLERMKKKKIGYFLRAFNSPEFIANQFTRYAFNDMDLFQVVPMLEKITFNDVKDLAESFIDESRISICQILPQK